MISVHSIAEKIYYAQAEAGPDRPIEKWKLTPFEALELAESMNDQLCSSGYPSSLGIQERFMMIEKGRTRILGVELYVE